MADTKIKDLPTDIVTLADGDKFGVADESAPTVNTFATALEIKTHGNTAPVFAAGTASANTWPKLTAGTILTAPEVGALELDANCLYGTTGAGNRGVIPIHHILRCDAVHTLNDSTVAQPLFEGAGALTLETGVYRYNLLALITAMSSTSGNAQILFGGTGTFAAWLHKLSGLDNSTITTVADDDTAFATTSAFAASSVAAGTGTAMRFSAEGTFECTAAGTFIPQIDLVTGGVTPAVAIGSFIEVWRIGSTAMTSVGQWS